MEVKQGYKQTEVGVIPEDWEVDSIVHLAAITTGDKNTQDRVDDGAYPFFVRSQTVERINSYTFDGEAVLTAGDGVGTGKIFHYIDDKFDFHQRVYKISDFGERLDGYYFFLYFSNNFFSRIMQMTAKSSVDSVRREMIADMRIPLPTLSEQRAIAAALSDVDALLAALDQMIAKKRDLKQATMQQLLTGKTRLPGFSGDWEVRRLSEHFNIYAGGDVPKHSLSQTQSEYHPYPIFANALKNRGLYGYTNERRSNADSLTITARGYLGHAEYRNQPFFPIVRLLVLEPNGELDARFTAYVVNDRVEYPIESTGVPQLTAPQVGKQSVASPPTITEQTAIAAVLSDMDAELTALEARRDKTRALKQGMMQELLTGRIRLV